MREIVFFSILLSILLFSCNDEVDSGSHEQNSIELESLAMNYYNSHKYDKALKCFSKIIEHDSTKGNVFYSRAYCYAILEEIEKSNLDYMHAISLNYNVCDCYFNLGCNYSVLLNDTLAYAYFRKAYVLDSSDRIAFQQMQFYKQIIEKPIY